MNRRSFINVSAKSLLGFGVFNALPASAWAHKERFTLTDIFWDNRDKTLYITHSYHIHGVEQTLFKAGVLDTPDLYDLRSRAQLALYTQDNFALTADGNLPLSLELVGAENSGRNCYVYQQVYLKNAPRSLQITCSLMRPMQQGMINHVDLNMSGEIISVKFKDKDGPRLIELSS